MERHLYSPPQMTAWRVHGKILLSRGVKRKNFKVSVLSEKLAKKFPAFN
jgi:hypothetical protein